MLIELFKLLLPLLKSLIPLEIEAAKAGFDGPLTAYIKSEDAGQSPRQANLAFMESYVRCCALPSVKE